MIKTLQRNSTNINKIVLIIMLNVFLVHTTPSQNVEKYIFIGHCYQANTDGSKVDYRIENFDFSDYDGVWLGGDVCSEASLE